MVVAAALLSRRIDMGGTIHTRSLQFDADDVHFLFIAIDFNNCQKRRRRPTYLLSTYH